VSVDVARARPRPAPPGSRQPAAGRLSGRVFVILLAVVGLIAVYATDQVVPATSAHQADLRVWLAARAAGFVTLGLLTLQVVLGLVLSHPANKTTWQLSRLLFPWHANVWVFVLAFLAMHIVTIVADPYAGVGIGGALLPGLSAYRTVPVAIGVIALYALLITGLTARYTQLLPDGAWLQVHRLGVVILVLAWVHGVLSGTDSVPMAGIYGASFVLVVLAAAYRYWVARSGRPTFSTTLPEVDR
jgi:DMSO/TMAO reductase YedYZ heme-binding membrane subunit